MLRRFVRAYQRVQPLTIGELWAVAITLRIVLVENLRRAARSASSRGRAARQEADALADRLLGVNGAAGGADRRRSSSTTTRRRLPAAFAVQLVQRLRDQDPRVTPALRWLEERLAAQGTTADEIVRDEHQRQGATNVTVRNIITSMRLISDVDWAELFESVSLVDDDAAAGSDFARHGLRDAQPLPQRHRGAGARLAAARSSRSRARRWRLQGSALQEPAGRRRPDSRERDPGLPPDRRRPPRVRSGGRLSRAAARAGSRRFGARIGIRGYIGGVVVVAAIALCRCRSPHWRARESAAGGSRCSRLLGLIPAIDAAMALVNRAVTRGFGATILPGLELRDGVPPQPAHGGRRADPARRRRPRSKSRSSGWRSTTSRARKASSISRCSRTGPTPRTETVAGDDALLDAAAEGIARLNRRYGPAAGGRPLPPAPSPAGLERRRSGGGWAGSASAASCTS